jgi:anti-sigma regulatory factor (Ser/Thr protein kinase)
LKQRFPDTPLLGIRGPETRESSVDLLKAGLYACLDSAQLAEEFAYNLIKLVASQSGTYNPLSLHYEERLLLLPNDFSLVLHVAKTLVETSLPPGEKSRYHVILGLSEIITNAIEHGNLGISFEEKSHALKASRFYALALERAHREPYRNRMVTVRCRILPHRHRIEYFVADQGQGFDWRALPDPREKGNMFSRHGRGILMARHAFDEFHFNDTGNEVTLVMNLDGPNRKKA